jgi:uncharacterized protein YjbI with pentapeptide repeats
MSKTAIYEFNQLLKTVEKDFFDQNGNFNVDLSGADLRWANLRGAFFSNADLTTKTVQEKSRHTHRNNSMKF